MKINYRLLPVKIHYFLFMAASGAVLPFLQVMGKQLGISEVVMGSITALLPPLFLIAKPLFGVLVDYFSTQRKLIFLSVLAGQNIAYGLLYFIPHLQEKSNSSDRNSSNLSSSYPSYVISTSMANPDVSTILPFKNEPSRDTLNESWSTFPSTLTETDSSEILIQKTLYLNEANLYLTPTFWIFVLLLSIGTVFFNVANSVSDAITFDILGEGLEMKYGKQRVWGTVGFGVAALISGLAMEFCSSEETIDKNYTPALALAIFFSIIDLVMCYYLLQIPLMPRSNHILRDVGRLVCHKKVAVFLLYATICGILDGFIIYYLFWYLEDLAVSTNHISSVKLLEGLVVAAETLCGETIFFYISGFVLKRLGNSDGEHSYARGLTVSLFSFSIRFGLISIASNPWWMLPVEAVMQGPTYALSYTAIVGYAAVVSPPGASSTMQGLVAGVDDGLGYALGSLIGGFLYKYLGGKTTFKVFAGVAAISGFLHHSLYECYLKDKKSKVEFQAKYQSPEKASEDTATGAEEPENCMLKDIEGNHQVI